MHNYKVKCLYVMCQMSFIYFQRLENEIYQNFQTITCSGGVLKLTALYFSIYSLYSLVYIVCIVQCQIFLNLCLLRQCVPIFELNDLTFFFYLKYRKKTSVKNVLCYSIISVMSSYIKKYDKIKKAVRFSACVNMQNSQLIQSCC